MNDNQEPTADLYIRVSTDEQADKGYSQRNQHEMLRKYCHAHAIRIGNIIYEDHSAKSFNRPGWKKLIKQLKKHRNCTSLILFTKWDRFSRNASDAYQMINLLRSLNVEPQAIEQPLDLSVPENKMMLAFYLAAPEVENDRRALNVFYGMRRAKKEGRYMGKAPVGYKNKITETGTKYIAPQEPAASVVQWAFGEIAKGIYNTEQIWKKARRKGIGCSKTSFWQLIRNPLYCGKILIPGFKDEEKYYVKGLHKPIISEELFDRVQQVLDNRGKVYRIKMRSKNEFLLRGFLICPKCGKLLTASKSKGRSRYYAYYHCSNGCPFRVSKKRLEKAFISEVGKYVPKKGILDVYEKIIRTTYYELTGDIQFQKIQLEGKLKEYEKRLLHVQELLAMDKIDVTDYSGFKQRYSAIIKKLKKQYDGIIKQVPSLQGLLSLGMGNLLRMDKVLEKGDNEGVRALVSMLYPDKLEFDGEIFRKRIVNNIIWYIYECKSRDL